MTHPFTHPERSDFFSDRCDRRSLPSSHKLHSFGCSLSRQLYSSPRKQKPSVTPSPSRQTHLHLTHLFRLPSRTTEEGHLLLSKASPLGLPGSVALRFSCPASLSLTHLSPAPLDTTVPATTALSSSPYTPPLPLLRSSTPCLWHLSLPRLLLQGPQQLPCRPRKETLLSSSFSSYAA